MRIDPSRILSAGRSRSRAELREQNCYHPTGGVPIREVARKLAEIVQQHGPEIADDERKLDDLLTRACGPKFTNETLMLVTAAMARVPTELRATGAEKIADADLKRLARRIQTEFGVTEPLARWAVATWAFALGIPPVGAAQASSDIDDPKDDGGDAPNSAQTSGVSDAARRSPTASSRPKKSNSSSSSRCGSDRSSAPRRWPPSAPSSATRLG
jgi:hypothetical protein